MIGETLKPSSAMLISAGPPACYVPFNPIAWLVRLSLAKRLSTVEGAEKFLQDTVFGKMGEAERKEFAQWRDAQRLEEGETERKMARNVVQSVATLWDGLLLVPQVLHADWGFRPDGPDENTPDRRS